MYTDSRIGQNIRNLAYTCGFYIQDLIKLTCTDTINRVYSLLTEYMMNGNFK